MDLPRAFALVRQSPRFVPYEYRSPGRAPWQRALSARILAEAGDLDDRPAGKCGWCRSALPAPRRQGQRYCTPEHRRAADAARKRQARAA